MMMLPEPTISYVVYNRKDDFVMACKTEEQALRYVKDNPLSYAEPSSDYPKGMYVWTGDTWEFAASTKKSHMVTEAIPQNTGPLIRPFDIPEEAAKQDKSAIFYNAAKKWLASHYQPRRVMSSSAYSPYFHGQCWRVGFRSEHMTVGGEYVRLFMDIFERDDDSTPAYETPFRGGVQLFNSSSPIYFTQGREGWQIIQSMHFMEQCDLNFEKWLDYLKNVYYF